MAPAPRACLLSWLSIRVCAGVHTSPLFAIFVEHVTESTRGTHTQLLRWRSAAGKVHLERPWTLVGCGFQGSSPATHTRIPPLPQWLFTCFGHPCPSTYTRTLPDCQHDPRCEARGRAQPRHRRQPSATAHATAQRSPVMPHTCPTALPSIPSFQLHTCTPRSAHNPQVSPGSAAASTRQHGKGCPEQALPWAPPALPCPAGGRVRLTNARCPSQTAASASSWWPHTGAP